MAAVGGGAVRAGEVRASGRVRCVIGHGYEAEYAGADADAGL
jgi:hypothetical protein